MRKVWLVVVAVAALMLAGGAFAQGKGKHGGKGGEKGAVRGGGGGPTKALDAIMPELTEDQKTKIEEAKQKMMKAREEGGDMKAASAEFEKALGGILTPEQMKKYTEARKAAMAEHKGAGEGKGEKKRGGEQE